MRPVSFSVVVPTRDRKDLLRGCLEALLRQSLAPPEVLVVDNGSGDGTSALLEREFSGRVRRVPEPRRGVHHARNRGLAEARHNLVLFTDDDVLAPPGWTESLVSCFKDPSVVCAGGPTRPLWLSPPPRHLLSSRRLRSCLGLVDFGPEPRLLDPASEFLVGANMALRRDAVGGGEAFREVIPYGPLGAGGDDFELSRRLARSAKALYEPAAWVHHRILPEKMRWGYLLHRTFLFSAGGARVGSRLKPRRALPELLGTEGWVSLVGALGHFYGRWVYSELP